MIPEDQSRPHLISLNLALFLVCELMSSKESKIYWDDLAEVPFAIVATNNETDSETIQSNL